MPTARPASCPRPAASWSACCPRHPSPPPRTVLGPGDTLLLYTDGLTEARIGDDRTSLYGDENLLAFAARHAGRPAPALIQALTGLLDSFGDGLDDDTALLALGVPATASHPADRR